MKRSLPWLLSASLFVTVPAHANINLSWDDCGTAGAENKQFACDTNVGTPFTMVASVNPYQTFDAVVAASGSILVLPTEESLPDWWKFGSGSCRGTTAMSASADFSTGPYTCADPWLGVAQTTLMYQTIPSEAGYYPERLRIQVACFMPEGGTATFQSGVESYVFKLRIARSGSAGTGACAGCTVPVCLVLENVSLYQPPSYNNDLYDTVQQDRLSASWRSAHLFTWDDFEHGRSGIGCAPDFPTPAARTSWGRVKSLYR